MSVSEYVDNLPYWMLVCADILSTLFFVSLIFLIIAFGISLIIKAKKQVEASNVEILLELQNGLLRQIDTCLIGIDCRLKDIQEKNSGGDLDVERNS